jgi:hypothetical protein
MKRIVFTFGIIAGIIVSAMMFLTMSEQFMEMSYAELIGYSTMIIAFATIFFAVRAYRERYLGGTIKIGKAFLIGLYITLIASTMYVASWMIISNTYGQNYMEQYYENAIEEIRSSDLSETEMDQQIQSIEDFRELYKNPFIKIGMTYMEILPIGLLISLLSAAILRKRKDQN